MKTTATLIALAASAVLHAPGHAAEPAPPRVDHYQARQADSVEAAVANLRDANRKLAALLAGEVDDYAIHDIHSLSYTIEESLQHLTKALRDLHGIAGDMHFATEGMKRDAVIDYGQAYLSGVRKIIE